MRKITLITLTLFSINLIYGQSAKEQLELINSVKLQNTEFYKEIPFENKFGYFIIPVKIGDSSYEYIFDTGGYNTLTSEIMDKNGLPSLMNVQVGSANQIKSKISLTQIPSVTIGGVNFKEIGALNFDFDKSPQIKCYTNGGLIGKSIIKEAVWQINANEKKIILTNNLNKLDHLNNSIKIKVKFDKTFNPFIKAKINGKTMTFLLDFGYGGLISLTEKDGNNIISKESIEIIGEGSVSANGIINESMFIKNLETFEIGNISFPNKVVYYSKSNNYNLIGSGITKHFIVTLNFKDKELYLTPIQKNDPEKQKASFGFDLNRNENKIYVNKLYKNLPAVKAGLKLNDTIISINEQEFIESSYCSFYEYVQQLLQENKLISLKVKRKDEFQIIEIIKSNLFEL